MVGEGGHANDRQRIDTWLWHARMVRTRSDATALAVAGHVRRNGKRVAKAGETVKVGDVVTLALDRAVKVLRVEALSDRRGDAPSACRLYRDLATQGGKALP